MIEFYTAKNYENEPFIAMVIDGLMSVVPIDERNADYQEYLAWLAQGNIPEEYNNGM